MDELRSPLLGNFAHTLRLAIAYTILGREPAQQYLARLLHELWLRGNYPFGTLSQGGFELKLQVLCAPSSKDDVSS